MRLALALLGFGPLVVSAATSFKVKDSVIPPLHWSKHSTPPADHVIELKIGLPQSQFDVLEQHLYQVSDPAHPRYGQHLTKAEVEALITPHPDSLNAVNEWLSSHGLDDSRFQRSPASDWITVKVPVSLAEKMLDTKYYVWKHGVSGDYLVRALSYSLPKHLIGHVDVIQPTTMFAQFKALKSTIHWPAKTDKLVGSAKAVITAGDSDSANSGATAPASCARNITITCLRQLYNVGNYTPSAHIGNSIGITGYLEQFANVADLQSFYSKQVPKAVGSNFTFISVKGGLNPQNLSDAGAEADLDVQFAFGLSHPIPATFYSTAGRPPFKPDVGTPTDTNEPYLDWLEFVREQENPPLSISTSYGDSEQTVPQEYAKRVCDEFLQLGTRGVSLLFSSGDGGVGDGSEDTNEACFTNDGKNQTRFIPGFPASCPFVTAVGGTVNIPETAVFFSGGGFSNYFPRPEYQDKAVEKFFQILPNGTYAGLFNPKGRGIPDVSAYSDFFNITLSGQDTLIGGTSASSPAFAGIVALLNDARLRAGQKPLGFLNPLLYTGALSGFNDITSGNAPGCGTPGFNATKGWDPVTGLGTPNFGKLRQIVTAPAIP